MQRLLCRVLGIAALLVIFLYIAPLPGRYKVAQTYSDGVLILDTQLGLVTAVTYKNGTSYVGNGGLATGVYGVGTRLYHLASTRSYEWFLDAVITSVLAIGVWETLRRGYARWARRNRANAASSPNRTGTSD